MPLIRKDDGAPTPPVAAGANASARLTEGTPDERWAAARALAEQSGSGPVLAGALHLERDARVREAILTSLIRQGGSAAVCAVIPLVSSDDASLRTEALDALRAMPVALEPYLADLLADRDPDVRLLSCDLARVLPAQVAARMLCEVLDREGEVNVCAAAIDALAEVGGPDAAPALARCAARFPDEPFLRFAIRAAAQRIGAGSGV